MESIFCDIPGAIENACMETGWAISAKKNENGTYDWNLSRRTDAGQDVQFEFETEWIFHEDEDGDNYEENPQIREQIHAIYENYDPDEETYLWLGPDGHGRNGAPYSLRAVLEDMESVDEALKKLCDLI